jgi:hypothetical protein
VGTVAPFLSSPGLIAAFGVAEGLGMGLAVALVTGLFLVRLLDRAKPASRTHERLTTC